MKRVAIWFSSRMHLFAKCAHVESKEGDNIGVILKRRFKSQVQHICSQLKKLGVFIESLDFFNSQLESTQ